VVGLQADSVGYDWNTGRETPSAQHNVSLRAEGLIMCEGLCSTWTENHKPCNKFVMFSPLTVCLWFKWGKNGCHLALGVHWVFYNCYLSKCSIWPQWDTEYNSQVRLCNINFYIWLYDIGCSWQQRLGFDMQNWNITAQTHANIYSVWSLSCLVKK